MDLGFASQLGNCHSTGGTFPLLADTAAWNKPLFGLVRKARNLKE